jgi:hypothetical protein
MREIRLSGSVEGVMGNHDSYSDSASKVPAALSRRPRRLRCRRSANSDFAVSLGRFRAVDSNCLQEAIPPRAPKYSRPQPVFGAGIKSQLRRSLMAVV